MLSQVFGLLRRLLPAAGELPNPEIAPDLTDGGIAAAVRRWQAQRIELRPPLPPAQVAEMLAPLPAAMRRDLACLYALCDGMPHGVDDDHMFALWPLEAMQARRDEWPVDFVFATGFIDANAYFLQPVGDDGYCVCTTYGEGDSTLLADSLDEMFGLLLRDPDKLMLP